MNEVQSQLKIEEIKSYSIWEILSIDSGYHFCCKSTNYSDFNEYGVEVTLYFKFLKHLIWHFFLLSILSLITLLLCMPTNK